MSTLILNRVLTYQRRDEQGDVQVMPAAEGLVLFLLSIQAHDDGFCCLELSLLARLAKLSVRQVQRALRMLEQHGEIVVRERRGRSRSNHYVVVVGMSERQLHATLTRRGWSAAEAQAALRRSKQVLSQKPDNPVVWTFEK